MRKRAGQGATNSKKKTRWKQWRMRKLQREGEGMTSLVRWSRSRHGSDDVPERRVLVAKDLSSFIVRMVDDLAVGTNANLTAIWSDELVGLQVKMKTVS